MILFWALLFLACAAMLYGGALVIGDMVRARRRRPWWREPERGDTIDLRRKGHK